MILTLSPVDGGGGGGSGQIHSFKPQVSLFHSFKALCCGHLGARQRLACTRTRRECRPRRAWKPRRRSPSPPRPLAAVSTFRMYRVSLVNQSGQACRTSKITSFFTAELILVTRRQATAVILHRDSLQELFEDGNEGIWHQRPGC